MWRGVARCGAVFCTRKRPISLLSNLNRNSRANYSEKIVFNAKMSYNRPTGDVLKILESIKKVIGTHDGIFHCDEILAIYMLQQLPEYRKSTICRSRDQKVLDCCDIVVDVGGIFDPLRNKFDHHQHTFVETLSTLRPELGSDYKIRLSSAGLIYTYFGEEVIKNILRNFKKQELEPTDLRAVYIKVYENFIREIDAIDNGVPMFEGEPNYNITTHLSARVSHFNPDWNTSDKIEVEDLFDKAKSYVGEEFMHRVFFYSNIWLPARSIVEKAIISRFDVHKSGEILELDQQCPWKEHLFELEKLYSIEGVSKYIIFMGKDEDDWRVICVPNQPTSFICRKFLHMKWRGYRDAELQEISGNRGATFVHATGFIGGNKTRKGALQMAIESLYSHEME